MKLKGKFFEIDSMKIYRDSKIVSMTTITFPGHYKWHIPSLEANRIAKLEAIEQLIDDLEYLKTKIKARK